MGFTSHPVFKAMLCFIRRLKIHELRNRTNASGNEDGEGDGNNAERDLAKKEGGNKKNEKRKRDSFRNSEIEKADPKRWKETPLLTRVKKGDLLSFLKTFLFTYLRHFRNRASPVLPV